MANMLVSKIESLSATENGLALDVQSHFIQCLLSESIECSNSWMYWVLRRYPLKSLLERWNCGHAISIIMTWCPIKNFCMRHWVGPRKSASNRAPHLLRPALSATVRFIRNSCLYFVCKG